MKNKTESKIEMLRYEQAFSTLEAAVETLEAGAVTVDEALVKFELGMKAAKRCMSLLDNAEQKMNLIVSDYANGVVLEPLVLAEDR